MKLKLENARDINILIAAGPITAENFTVLKAGIKKLFKDGKNKIILELPDSGGILVDVLRELAVLNLLASELAGQIVLADIAPLTRSKIDSFSVPPAVRCFPNRAAAVDFFHPKSAEEIPHATPASPTASPAAAQTPAPSIAPAASTKEEVRAREIGDLGELRKRLAELETENKEMGRRLTEIVIKRRDPPDLQAWQEKVSKLESDLGEAILAAQANAPKK